MLTNSPIQATRSLLKKGTARSVHAEPSQVNQQFRVGDRVVCPLFNKLLVFFFASLPLRETPLFWVRLTPLVLDNSKKTSTIYNQITNKSSV
jgi:hypothetical protein